MVLGRDQRSRMSVLPFGNLISTGLIPVYRQCRRFIADGPMPWASDIDSMVSGVESGSVARGSVESGIKASGSDEK